MISTAWTAAPLPTHARLAMPTLLLAIPVAARAACLPLSTLLAPHLRAVPAGDHGFRALSNLAKLADVPARMVMGVAGPRCTRATMGCATFAGTSLTSTTSATATVKAALLDRSHHATPHETVRLPPGQFARVPAASARRHGTAPAANTAASPAATARPARSTVTLAPRITLPRVRTSLHGSDGTGRYDVTGYWRARSGGGVRPPLRCNRRVTAC